MPNPDWEICPSSDPAVPCDWQDDAENDRFVIAQQHYVTAIRFCDLAGG